MIMAINCRAFNFFFLFVSFFTYSMFAIGRLISPFLNMYKTNPMLYKPVVLFESLKLILVLLLDLQF